MEDPYQQTFAATDGQNNVTYIQFINPNPTTANIIYECKEDMQEDYLDQEYEGEETIEETIEESYIEEEPLTETIEVLESVVVDRKRIKKEPETSFTTVRKLVQKNAKGW
jgi:hypothetical protein